MATVTGLLLLSMWLCCEISHYTALPHTGIKAASKSSHPCTCCLVHAISVESLQSLWLQKGSFLNCRCYFNWSKISIREQTRHNGPCAIDIAWKTKLGWRTNHRMGKGQFPIHASLLSKITSSLPFSLSVRLCDQKEEKVWGETVWEKRENQGPLLLPSFAINLPPPALWEISTTHTLIHDSCCPNI